MKTYGIRQTQRSSFGGDIGKPVRLITINYGKRIRLAKDEGGENVGKEETERR